MTIQSMADLDLSNKRVMIREDLNVPMQEGRITSDERIKRALPAIQSLIKQNAAVMILSHFGRPTEGKFDHEFSLAPVADALSNALDQTVRLEKDWLNGVDVKPGEVVLCENVRFNVGEKKNDPALAKKMAALCDVFVMDAFATAHRAQASTAGITEYAKEVCAGPLLLEELNALSKGLSDPKRPLVAIVGGSKVSTKIQVLESLIDKVDVLIVGGGIANTFLAAEGHNIGASLYEADWLASAKQLLTTAKEKDVSIPLPIDVAVATEFSASANAMIRSLDAVAENEMILDVGPQTANAYPEIMQSAGTIVWNGPVGVFEFPAFENGTRALGEAIAQSNAFSIAGGGDTIAALDQFNIEKNISYVCTGGGAFLEYLEGKPLPAVVALEQRAKTHA
ncbi:MAG: phosphoglycerate kinase [Coxiellaceae bacterium]|nr:phosphoglycerate kinase [Coxiellaceae bacterium]